MKLILRCISAFLLLFSTPAAFSQDIVINEVDSDNAGTDTMEFIELIGPADASLDGLILVCYNGLVDAPYLFFDLDGQVLDSQGYFVVGSEAVANVDLVMENNSLQNGPEAIALYTGNEEDFTDAGVVVDDTLLDAIVYGTNDSDDAELLVLLNPDQPQVNESAVNGSSFDSMSRVPNGGIPRNTDTYVAQAPTPGESNVLACVGGSIFDLEGLDPISFCSDSVIQEFEFGYETITPDASYLFVVTDNLDAIVLASVENSIDFAPLPEGSFRVYGLAYTGTLDEASLLEGEAIEAIVSDDCLSLTSNFVSIEKLNCTPPSCEVGEILLDDGGNQSAMCLDGGDQFLSWSFDATLNTEGAILYLLTNGEDEIIEVLTDSNFDFTGLAEGVYHVWGLAYTGELFEGTIQVGDPVANVDSDGDCTELSVNFITVERLDCVVGVGCTELFISEYIEGSVNNKALEIVNPTDAPIDLDPYVLHVYNNGATAPTNSLNLQGVIAPGDVYVVVSPDADASWQAYADVLSQVTWFSGNDPVALLNGTEFIDIMGEIGYSLDAPFTVGGGGSMQLHTLRRKVTVTQGTTDWDEGVSQWDVFPPTTITGLGEHVFIPCDNDNPPTVNFEETSLSLTEGQVAVVPLAIANATQTVTVTVELDGGSATPVDDFNDDFPIEVIFEAGGPTEQNIVFLTIDDILEESQETVDLVLTTEDENVIISIEEFTLFINDNDTPAPVYQIQEVAQVDDDGVADSLNVYCEIRGLVYGFNLRPGGLQFTLGDTKDGIGIFNLDNDFAYTVNERDSLHVIGTIDQFNGLTQMLADTVIFIQSDLELLEAEDQDEPNEEYESQLLRLDCVSLVDPGQWTNEEPGFNVEITDGSFISEMRIDADVDLFGGPAPEGVFDLIGIGGQFDPDSPYDEGYQILPRYASDITFLFDADFELSAGGFEVETSGDTCLVFGDVEHSITHNGAGETISWIINGLPFPDGESVNFNAGAIEWMPGEDVTVEMTVTVGSCSYTVSRTYCADSDILVSDSEEFLMIYPNPTQGVLRIKSSSTIEILRFYSMEGRLLKVETPMHTNHEVNTALWPSGSYLLEVESAGILKRQRIIKR